MKALPSHLLLAAAVLMLTACDDISSPPTSAPAAPAAEPAVAPSDATQSARGDSAPPPG